MRAPAPGARPLIIAIVPPRILLASCAALPTSDGDDDGLVDALGELGLTAAWSPWDDPDAAFADAELVVLRSTWDYTARREEFLVWCAGVPRLANPAGVVRWNTDKAYLLELAAVGVPVVPTTLVAPGEPLPAELPDTGDGVVLKPAVGAGSRGAGRFASADAAAAHLQELHRDGHTVLLQPFQASVATSGEVAVVFLGGVYSHAFSKGSMLAGSGVDASGLFRSERLGAVRPDGERRRVAEDVLDAAARVLGIDRADLLYARVDLVAGADGEPLLLELELTEPGLGFGQADDAAPARFASAVRAALAR